MKENKNNKIYHYEKNDNKVKRNNILYDEEYANEFGVEDRQLQLQKQQIRMFNRTKSSKVDKTAK